MPNQEDEMDQKKIEDVAVKTAQQADSAQSMALNAFDALIDRAHQARLNVLAGQKPAASVSGDIGLVQQALEVQRLVDEMLRYAAVAAELGESVLYPRYRLTLTAVGERRIHVIKEIRSANGMGLRDAKDIIDLVSPLRTLRVGRYTEWETTAGGVPQQVASGLSKGNADALARKFEAVGATVTVEIQ